ncbi:hypothetical protein AX16_007737 [Volvariella volvacea WC 439]|nr:hypothetical protein AX16_007737 [Volvariella volvacea WC 439]
MSEESRSQTAASVSNGDTPQQSSFVSEKNGSETNGTIVEPVADQEKAPKAEEVSANDQNPGVEIRMDSGRTAWMTLAGAWLIQFCTFGYVSAYGVYQDFYTREFLSNSSPSDISWIGSFQIFVQYLLSAFVGRALDAGYFRQLIAVGTVLQVFSMFMLSLAKQGQYYQVFLAQALGMGLGQGLLFLPSLIVIGHHFKRRRAFATGIAVSGVSVGGIVWPIMLNQLSQRTTFANAIRATAGLAAVLLCVANFITKTRPRVVSAPAPQPPNIKSILRDNAYTVSIAGAFCISLGLFFPYFYLQLYAIDKGVSTNLAFYVALLYNFPKVAILNSGSVLGRILPNFFADRLGAYNMLLACLVCSAVLAFCIFAVQDFAGIVVFGILYGFFSGSCESNFFLALGCGLAAYFVHEIVSFFWMVTWACVGALVVPGSIRHINPMVIYIHPHASAYVIAVPH